MKSPNCLYTIEFSRGMAALVILALHVILFGHQRYEMAFPIAMGLSDFLSVGVDLFFVVSGFLMVHTTRDIARRSPKEFLLKRFIRIYPAYWLVLLAILPVYFFKPEWAFFGATVKPSLLLSFLLLPQQGPPILAVAWTLVYEVYFYLLFAATLFLKPRMQLIILSLYFIASMLIGHFLLPVSRIIQFFTADIMMEFLSGMLLAHFWYRFPRIKYLSLLCFTASILFIALHPLNGISRAVSLGIPALLIFIGMLSIEKNGTKFPLKTAHFFGRISYTLYLVHVPIIAGLPKLVPYLGIHLPLAILLILATILSLVAGIVLHYWYEVPIQKSIKRFLAQRKIKLKTCSVEDY